MDELTKRNLHSLSTGLKLLRAENTKNAEKIGNLEGTIVQLQKQIQLLQQQNATVMGKAFGSGPTG